MGMKNIYDPPIRLGIISFAHGHVNLYAEATRDFPDAVVVAGWDDNITRGQAQCAHHGITFEPDLDTLLRRDDIDAVWITSPTNRHAQHAIAAAQAGKAIFLQKPMALTLDDCDGIIFAVHQYNVPFSMCYQMRVDPVNQKIKSLLDEGAVGNIAVVRRRHAINALLNPTFARPDNWHVDPVQNKGMFMDDASHAADWFYWMLGKPVSVIAEIDNVVTQVAADDNGVAVYRFGKGEMGILLNSSTTLAAEATTEIYGDKGTIVQNYGDLPSSLLPRPEGASALKIFRAGTTDWEHFDFPHVQQGQRIKAVPRPLVDYLLDKGEPIATAEEGRIGVEMILAAYQAAEEGRRVRF
jgi:predicted dehydrogenase